MNMADYLIMFNISFRYGLGIDYFKSISYEILTIEWE